MLLKDDIEYLIHCDEKGNTISPISRKHAHLPEIRKKLCHKAIVVMVYCKQTNKWCIQKKFSKAINKSIWDPSVGGHCTYEKKNNSYEELSYEKTLLKEAYEELGLKISINESLESNTGFIIKTHHYKNSYNNEFLGLGIIVTGDEEITPIDSEVLNFKWLTTKELENFIRTENISDTLKTFFPIIKEEFDKLHQ